MQNELQELIGKLVKIQEEFRKKYGVGNIYSNSKFFEILIADRLNHRLLPGASGSRDARDDTGDCEYKHYKESSSNHTWTFNDFSDTTIKKLNNCHMVFFAHINDLGIKPTFDWFYPISGPTISQYLAKATQKIKNTRKMINVSVSQLETVLGIKRAFAKDFISKNYYTEYLDEIFSIAARIEKIVGTKGILTSNKIWEILVSLITGHKALSEQKKHDAVDNKGGLYEYKVSQSSSWNFEDISPAVLQKFLEEKAILLATVNKEQMKVLKIFSAEPKKVIQRLNEKLNEKARRFRNEGKVVRRLQVSLSGNDLKIIDAIQVYNSS